MNHVTLIGNVGRDAEVRAAGSSHKMSFSLATNERYTDKDGQKVDKVTWHNCVLWGERAEKLASYIKQGMRIGLMGKIDNRKYEKDGQDRYISEIVVSDIEFLDAKKEEASNDGARSSNGGRSSSARASGNGGGRASSSGSTRPSGKNGKGSAAQRSQEDVDGEPSDDVDADNIPF